MQVCSLSSVCIILLALVSVESSLVMEPLRYLPMGCVPVAYLEDQHLDALDETTVPYVLVACKCDQLPEDGELGPIHERHDIYRTSPESPRSQQMCIALVLRSVISHRAGEFLTKSIIPFLLALFSVSLCFVGPLAIIIL